MKKQIMVLAGAVILLAVLVGVYFGIRGKSGKEEAKEMLLDLTADRIQGISWTPEGGETLSFHRVDGEWSYDGDKEFRVDQSKMNTVCSGVTGITVYQTMEEVTDLAQYGLDTPEYMLNVTDTEGKTTEIAIGADNGAVSYLYVYKDGDSSKVYAVMASLKTSIAKQLSELKAADESD